MAFNGATTVLLSCYFLLNNSFLLQGDSSKMGQTLRLKPRFNTVPLHFFFKLLCFSVVQVNYCTVDHSNLKKSWEGTVLKQGFNLNICPILKESPCRWYYQCRVVEVSATILTMKGCVIFLIHLTTAVNLIIVPDLHHMNAGLYHHK